MSYTITELSLRSIIVTALDGLLGTYTYSDGSTETAFKATDGTFQGSGHPWPYGPEVPTVTGLEAILAVDVDGPRITPLMGGDYYTYKACRLDLTQHDTTNTTRAAASAVLKALAPLPTVQIQRSLRIPRMSPVDNLEVFRCEFLYSSSL
jgi:hypothetical protein